MAMETLLFFTEKPADRRLDPERRRRTRASDVASSLARIDLMLGRDGEEEPDPLSPPEPRALRIWCTEE
jgi:hypothetical protein